MEIQLALDLLDKKQALETVKDVGKYVDIIEVGTSLLKLEGINIVDEIRNICPTKPIFVDIKIIDGPEREATLMEMAKADYYSMLAMASDTAVKKVLKIANETGAKVIFDMQSVGDYQARSVQLKELGAEFICVHKNADCGSDLNEAFKEFIDIKHLTQLPVSIAGGINLQTLPLIKQQLNPDIVVIGGTILNAADRQTVAKTLRKIADS